MEKNQQPKVEYRLNHTVVYPTTPATPISRSETAFHAVHQEKKRRTWGQIFLVLHFINYNLRIPSFLQMSWYHFLYQMPLCRSTSTRSVRPGGRRGCRRRKSLVAPPSSSLCRRASFPRNQSVFLLGYFSIQYIFTVNAKTCMSEECLSVHHVRLVRSKECGASMMCCLVWTTPQKTTSR